MTYENPFSYGNELGAGQLLDRKSELAQVERTIRDGRKLFMIGPRRFGKTSISKRRKNGSGPKMPSCCGLNATHPLRSTLSVPYCEPGCESLSGEAKWVGEQLANFFSMSVPT